MSDNGVTIEQIAGLVGHKTTVVTQKVYRYQLKPVISHGRDRHEHHLRKQEKRLTRRWLPFQLPTADPASRTA
jgi:hypothetical protein